VSIRKLSQKWAAVIKSQIQIPNPKETDTGFGIWNSELGIFKIASDQNSFRLRYLFFTVFIFFTATGAFCQDKKKVDSLLGLLKAEIPDTQRATVYNALASAYQYNDQPRFQLYSLNAIRAARASGNEMALAVGYMNYGFALENEARYDLSITYYDSAKTAFSQMGNELYAARMDLNRGNIYNKKGELSDAAKAVLASLTVQEKLKDTFGIAVCKFTLGNITYGQGNPKAALALYQESWQISRQIPNNNGFEASVLGNIGAMFQMLEEYDSARYYMRIALDVFTRNNIESKYGTIYNNIGQTFEEDGQYDSAMHYRKLALYYHRKANRADGVGSVLVDIGDIYAAKGMNDSALYYYESGLSIFRQIGARESRLQVYWKMSELFEAKKNYAEALRYSKLYIELNDSLHGAEQNNEIEILKRNFELDKKDQLVRIADAEAKAANERDRRNTILFIVASVAGLIVTVVIFLMFKTKKRHNKILEQKNTEIYRQNDEISQQKEEITASINYAKRIQEAILPRQDDIRKALPESFVLWMPRDIVSGDFYWFTQKADKLFIACVDCTGHGVPGAFMSMIGNAFLNEIVNEKNISEPAAILEMLHERISYALKQNEQERNQNQSERSVQDSLSSGTIPHSGLASRGSVQDGMDIALCAINKSFDQVAYAGANRPLWIVSKGELRELAPNKQSIGGTIGSRRAFTEHFSPLQKGDCIYMSSDGYPDQFGGEKGKKFMTKRFQQLLASLYEKEMPEQKIALEETFNNWKTGHEQIDDVLVIGIKIR
jgi:serine phosphatase RsbU (regulator of sigma subunit)